MQEQNLQSIPSKEAADPALASKEKSLYKIEEIPFEGRTIVIVHMEHCMPTADKLAELRKEIQGIEQDMQSGEFETRKERAEAKLLTILGNFDINVGSRIQMVGGERPMEWREILESQIDKSSLIFLEYFPPEILREAGKNKLFGRLVRHDLQKSIEPFFGTVGAIAGKLGKDICVSDIGNRVAYEAYEVPETVYATARPDAYKFKYRGHNTAITDEEEKTRAIIDARRLLTAIGITQEARTRTEGSRILYIAPPAHATRVSHYLRKLRDDPDNKYIHDKARGYLRKPGLDRNVRIYKPGQSIQEFEISLLCRNYDSSGGDRLSIYSEIREKLQELRRNRESDDNRKIFTKIRLTLAEIDSLLQALSNGDIKTVAQTLSGDSSWIRYSHTPIRLPQ